MKRVSIIAMALALAFGAFAENVTIVEITDMAGNCDYQIMSKEEIAQLKKDIDAETKIFNTYLAQAKKLWMENEEFKKYPFPATRIKPRKFKAFPPLPEDKADIKMDKLKEKAEEKRAKDSEKEEAKFAKMKDGPAKDRAIEKNDELKAVYQGAVQSVMKLMGEKLERPIPSFDFAITSALEAEKKAAEKKAAAEKKPAAAEKKAADKKDEKKADKKEEKK